MPGTKFLPWLLPFVLTAAWAEEQPDTQAAVTPPSSEEKAILNETPMLRLPVTTPEPYTKDDIFVRKVPTHVGTLGAALRRVWLTYPDVLAAQSDLAASGYDIEAARSGFYPYVQAQNAQTRGRNQGIGNGSGTLLTYVLPLWDGGGTLAQLDQAKAAQRQAESGVSLARLNVGLRLNEAYFAALAAQTQVDIHQRNIDVLNTLSQSISRRASAGAAPDVDVKTAITRVRLAEAQLAQARALEFSQKGVLKQLLNEEPGQLAWPLKARLTPQEIQAALPNALDGNPNILKAKADGDFQEAQVRINRSKLSPSIALQHQQPIGNYASVLAYPEQTQLVVNFSTESGFRAATGWLGAGQKLESAKNRAETARREVEQTVLATEIQLDALLAQIASQRSAVEASQALVQSFFRQYVVGRKSWIEVLNAQREANDAQIQYVAQQQTYWQAATKLALISMYWDRWMLLTNERGVANIMDVAP